MTNVAVLKIELAQIIRWTVELRPAVCKRLLYPHVTHATMSLVDNIENTKHVGHNAVALFMN